MFNDPSLMVTTCGPVGAILDFVPTQGQIQGTKSVWTQVQFNTGLANKSILPFMDFLLIFIIMVYFDWHDKSIFKKSTIFSESSVLHP